MLLSYQISRQLGARCCDGHNISYSVSMSNGSVKITTCCAYFRNDVEKMLITAYGRDFVARNVKFYLAGPFSNAAYITSAAEDEETPA